MKKGRGGGDVSELKLSTYLGKGESLRRGELRTVGHKLGRALWHPAESTCECAQTRRRLRPALNVEGS
eukprot:352738-Chlamydomonas_euryale.AAC.2